MAVVADLVAVMEQIWEYVLAAAVLSRAHVHVSRRPAHHVPLGNLSQTLPFPCPVTETH